MVSSAFNDLVPVNDFVPDRVVDNDLAMDEAGKEEGIEANVSIRFNLQSGAVRFKGELSFFESRTRGENYKAFVSRQN